MEQIGVAIGNKVALLVVVLPELIGSSGPYIL